MNKPEKINEPQKGQKKTKDAELPIGNYYFQLFPFVSFVVKKIS
jgi:hypothetical protein